MIGITQGVDVDEISAVSSYPQTEGDSYWLAEDFNALPNFVDNIIGGACGPAPVSGLGLL